MSILAVLFPHQYQKPRMCDPKRRPLINNIDSKLRKTWFEIPCSCIGMVSLRVEMKEVYDS